MTGYEGKVKRMDRLRGSCEAPPSIRVFKLACVEQSGYQNQTDHVNKQQV